MLSYTARKFARGGVIAIEHNAQTGWHLADGAFVQYGNWSSRVGSHGCRVQDATLYDREGKYIAGYDASSDEVYR